MLDITLLRKDLPTVVARLETQLDLVGKVGLENYLQSQMGVHGDD